VHLWVVVGCVVVIVLSCLMATAGSETVYLGRLPVANYCLFRRVTGINCPLCGLTRSLVALGHADVAASWRFHRAGWLVFLFLLVQIPVRCLLVAGAVARTRRRLEWVLRTCNSGVLVGVLASWNLTLLAALGASLRSMR
jgi:hypothetical protein